MSGIDQLLSLVRSQGCDELILAVDQEPQMFARGQRRRLTMAKTGALALNHIVLPLLTAEREAILRGQGRVTLDYHAKNVGTFRATFTERGAGTLKVTFQFAASIPSEKTHESSFPPNETTRVAPLESEPCRNFALRELVHRAFQAGASDIHLADQDRVYFRIDGRLSICAEVPRLAVTEYFEISDDIREKLFDGQSTDFGLDIAPGQRLRVSIYRSSLGLCAAIRLLPESAPSLESLNLPVAIDDLVDFPHGLVLVCGATGSGKSTTLAALAQHALNSRSIVLVTLEDPVEFRLNAPTHSVVRRRQIGRDVANFRDGLRDALRGDPDVIMVGELRDPETIQLALTAAETGHLVLASLHSGSAASTVERIIDAYPAERRAQIRVQLADALRAIIAQKLVPRAQGAGRVPAMEILRATHAASNIIREGRTAQIGTLLQSGKREGMLSLDRCLADYVRAKIIGLEQAHAAALDPESFEMFMVNKSQPSPAKA
jgi:twitching motility protein PilT